MKTKTNTTHKHNTTEQAKESKKLFTKKIKNWSAYNKALKNRGNLSIFIAESVIRDGKIVQARKTGAVGRPNKYSNEMIEFVLTVRELFRLPLRQVTGLMEYLFGLMGLSSEDVPDYTTLSRRTEGLTVRFNRKERREGVVLLIDSSGFKVFGEGEWFRRKHGMQRHRTWRETHIAIDWESRDIIGLINTTAHVHDNTQLEPLLQQVRTNRAPTSSASQEHDEDTGVKCKVKTIIGDGAYDSKDNYLLGRQFGIEFIAPPRVDAIEHLNHERGYQWYDTPGWEERNATIRHIEEYGLDGWMADVEYHRRSLVENAFYRMKTIFGDNLRARKETTQYTEQCIKAKIINQFNALGLPKYEWVR